MSTRFACFIRKAQQAPAQYTALMGLVSDPVELADSFTQVKDKAPGVDGVRKADYAENLDGKLKSLSLRLRRLAYRPQPVRRVYIPKGRNERRPLGIPAFEDRIVQDRISRIMQAIWEPEFLDSSYGFRPGRNAHQALRRVSQIITCEQTQYVVEADIKGFFDHVDHDWMMRFVRHRIKDPTFKRIVHRFLKAGVMEDGVVRACEEGTPQGGLVSPVLANIYLHYVLDLWFEKRFARKGPGKAFLVRYADDFVVCCQSEEAASQFLEAVKERLAKFGLELSMEKTRILRFGSEAKRHGHQEGDRRARTFDFLGLTHFVSVSRSGRFKVGRKTARGRFSKKLAALNVKMSQLRLTGGKAMMEYFIMHVRGHYQYYGVSDNLKGLCRYYYAASRILFKWLNRRSQRRSIDWDRFRDVLARETPRPRIVHSFYPLYA